MKLKKIASLALAGVMAVSMLAGCGDNASSNGNTNPGEQPEVVPTSAVLDIINNNQDPNKTQIKFTEDSEFAKQAAKAVAEIDYNASGSPAGDVATKLQSLTGADYALRLGAISITSSDLSSVGFLSDTMNDKESTKGDAAKKDGNKSTLLIVTQVTGVLSDEAAAYAAVKGATTNLQELVLDKLPADASDTTLADEDEYLSYTYTGKACVISTMNGTGAPMYYVVYEITQTAALETVNK